MAVIHANGVRMNVIRMDHADAAAEDLVMVHGLATNLAFWYLQMAPELNRDYRVTLYDLRGHGRSERTESGYAAADLATDLQKLLDHLEIDHAIQVMRPEISSLLLRKWDFGNDLILVAEQCGDWSRNETSLPDLCDLVLVANYYAMLHSDENHLLPMAGAIPAIEKFRITPDLAIEAIRKSANVKRNIKKLFV